MLRILKTVGLFGAGVSVLLGATSCTPAQKGLAIAMGAKSEIGKPYAPLGPYQRLGPDRFDCEGLVWYLYHRAGVTLPNGATAQYGATVHITAAQARPGDLAFFHKNNDPSGWYYHHVGVVTGPNAMVSALGVKYGVVATSISGVADRNGWVAYGRVPGF
jgi:cell wall-associated NlpC family hydrolase